MLFFYAVLMSPGGCVLAIPSSATCIFTSNSHELYRSGRFEVHTHDFNKLFWVDDGMDQFHNKFIGISERSRPAI
jgi:hypothetical protein